MHDDHNHHHDHHDHGHAHGKDCGHSHGHGHGHGHGAHDGHDHSVPTDFSGAFALGVLLNSGFVVAEAIYGYLANSMALIADAGHNLSDVLGLLLAWGAVWLSKRRPSAAFSYGLRSSSILASLGNAILLLLVTGGIAWESIMRLQSPAEVATRTVMIVAACGIAVNGITAYLFHKGRKNDLNIRAAYAHMLSDAVVSLGVVIAGFVIMATNWFWLDPAISLVVSVVIIAGTWGILRDSVNLALQGVPAGVSMKEVENFLKSAEGVTAVHDLHVWGMSTTETALTAHLMMPKGHPGDVFVQEICTELKARYSIHHSTIQIELGDGAACQLGTGENV